MASFRSSAIAPVACRSPAVTASPLLLYATTILDRRAFKSSMSVARHRIAMISEATVMSNPLSRITPSPFLPRPTMMWRRERSFISITRFHTIFFVTISSAFPWWMWLSSIAANRLCAEVMAWKSPVKCRLISSIGTTWEYPPPAAPPLMPKHGPRDGSLSVVMVFFPSLFSAIDSPTFVVVFPSPAGVGLMAVTSTSFPLGRSFSRSNTSGLIFALYFPYSSNSSSEISN